MIEFAMEHPIVTFFIVLIICQCVYGTVVGVAMALAGRKEDAE